MKAPWKAMPSTYSNEIWKVMEGRKKCIAHDQTQAYARLIAAAPDMLEALRTLTADMSAAYRDQDGDKDHDAIEKATAAIAKAGGWEL